MDGLYAYMLTFAALSIAGVLCANIMPNGSMGRSGKKAASIFVLAYALRALLMLLGRVDGGF